MPLQADVDPTGTFYKNYLHASGDTFKDPDGSDYSIKNIQLTSSATTGSASDYGKHEIRFYKQAYCNGETPTYKAGNNNYALVYKLEGAGTACLDNQ